MYIRTYVIVRLQLRRGKGNTYTLMVPSILFLIRSVPWNRRIRYRRSNALLAKEYKLNSLRYFASYASK